MTSEFNPKSPHREHSDAIPAAEAEQTSTGTFPDLRPETRQQKKQNSTLRESPQMKKDAALGDLIYQSPKMAAQAKFVHGLQAPLIQRTLHTFSDIEAAAGENRFNWRSMRTDLSETSASSKGKAKGLGAKTTEGTRLKTKVSWKGVDPASGEGTEMHAKVLGPDHKLGSEPQGGAGKVWNRRRVALSKEAGGKKYIAGHLLNNNLGGPGNDARNLTAIPATANTTQSARIEEEVKNLVNNQHLFVMYKVKIAYSDDPGGKNLRYASQIDSTWNTLDKDGNEIPPVKSAIIDIPAPSALGSGDEIDYGDNEEIVTTAGAATAEFDEVNDVVLNNAGYLAVATVVQRSFVSTMEKLKAMLAEAQSSAITSESERDDMAEKVEVMQGEVSELHEQLGDFQRDLDGKAADLAAMEKGVEALAMENAELKGAIQHLQETTAAGREEVARLQDELAHAKAEIRRLKIEKREMDVEMREKDAMIEEQAATIERTEIERDALAISHAASQDVMALPGGEMPRETGDEFHQLLENIHGARIEAEMRFASLSDAFEEAKRRREALSLALQKSREKRKDPF